MQEEQIVLIVLQDLPVVGISFNVTLVPLVVFHFPEGPNAKSVLLTLSVKKGQPNVFLAALDFNQ